jgi:hypothetical protein
VDVVGLEAGYAREVRKTWENVNDELCEFLGVVLRFEADFGY